MKIKMENSKFFYIVAVFTFAALVALAAAPAPQYVQTTMYFTNPETLSFTVTLPGYGANTSNQTSGAGSPATVAIEFNGTFATSNAQPCVRGGSALCQTGPTVPIFQYDNTGNANITLQLRFSSALSSTVTVCVNSTAEGTGNQATHHTGCFDVNDSAWAIVVQNLTPKGTNLTNATLYANFSDYSVGSEINRRLDHNASRAVGS